MNQSAWGQMRDVRDYLSLGFKPSEQLARDLRRILPSGPGDEKDARTLLRKILDEEAYQKGHRSVCLPLTAGYDSRSILELAQLGAEENYLV
ncbi:hypothetical protein [Mesorhizobium marinum]|uniref:hypothetical protein n=1 Tax=Mesorhizobium marinum TaxID=3228790 RepID=UPI003465C672